MADDITNDVPIYCNRRVLTDTDEVKFRFFIDIDMKTVRQMSEDQLTQIARICQRSVMQYWPRLLQEECELVVMRNNATQVEGTLPEIPRNEGDEALYRMLVAIRDQRRQESAGQLWKQGLHLHALAAPGGDSRPSTRYAHALC